MADYYPLIARAVASLETNSGENRRALYERARTALVAQLRGVVPALAESDITRERLALEEAIRKVEGEAARRPRLDLPQAPPPPRMSEPPPRAPEPPRREEDVHAARAAPASPRRPGFGGGESGPDAPRAEPLRPQSSRGEPAPPPRPEPPRAAPSSFEARRSPPQPPRADPSPFEPSPRREPSPRFEPPPRAETPRGAPPQFQPPPRREPPRVEPARAPRNWNPQADSEPEPRAAPPRRPPIPPQRGEPSRDQAPHAEPAGEDSLWEHPTYDPQPAEPVRMPPMRGEALRNLAAGGEVETQRGPLRSRPGPGPEPGAAGQIPGDPAPHEFDRLEPQIIDEDFDAPPGGSYPQAVEPVYDGPRFETRGRSARRDDGGRAAVRPVRVVSYGKIVKIVALALAVAGLAGLAYWQRASIAGIYESFRGVSSPSPREAATNGKPKIADRVGNEKAPAGASPSGQAGPAVAQRVVLYEEESNNPQGKRYVGSALWRVENVSPGAGQPPQLTVRADVEIPERRMTMTFSIRRNTDQTLPASHTIEITFNIPADFPGGGIGNVPGVLMKQAEQTRGVPLAGLAVKVTTGFFLIGLSAVEADVQRNVLLLKERAWFDIPLVYSNNQRAILAIEKGTPGDRAFDEAFAAWERAAASK